MRRLLLFFILLPLIGCASWQNDNKEKAALFAQIGNSNFEGGDYPAALRALLQAEKLDPENAPVQNNLGLVYFMRERYDTSEKHLHRALTLQPNFTDARNNLARVLIEEGRYTEAKKELRIVLNDLTYNGFAKAYINLGLAYFNEKNYQQSMTAFGKTIELENDNCVAHSYYGRSLFELKEYSRAASALDRAISFCQKQLYDEPHYYSALAYYRTGQKSKAVARFEEIIKIYPNGTYRDKSKAMLDLIGKGKE
jgi:type IV pilus assembly protein PilF